MIRMCSGTCGLRENVQPIKDCRTITFKCEACKRKDRREAVYKHRTVLVKETVVTETLVVYHS